MTALETSLESFDNEDKQNPADRSSSTNLHSLNFATGDQFMRYHFSRRQFASFSTCLAIFCLSLGLTGCAFSGGSSSSGSGTLTPVLKLSGTQGSVIGGQNPVSGALIQLYQIGVGTGTSYVANAKPLVSSTILTDSGGNFDLTGQYSCVSGTYLYITASGGNPGLSSGVNANITLMASVGLCDNLSQATFIAINEETTVAMAYAFAQYGRTSLFGTALSTQSTGAATPAINFATSSSNIQGIANAAAMANVLVNPVAGRSPGGNGNGTLNNPLTLSGLANNGATGAVAEFWQINTIADILAACVNSGGVAGSSDTTSNCAILFSNVVPFTGTAAPADTAQAALDLALTPNVPAGNISNLYLTIPSTAPFLPYVTTAASITDFSVGVQIKPVVPGTTTELVFEPSWAATDSNGNIWLTNSSTTGTHPASLLELSPTGAPIPAGTAAGNTAANYLINSYTMNGTTTPFVGQYQTTTATPPVYEIIGKLQGAIDTNNNVWISDRGSDSVMKVFGSGATGAGIGHNGGNAADAAGSGAVGYQLLAGSAPILTFVDGSNNVWTMLANSVGGVGTTAKPGVCGTNYMYNSGLAGFLGGDPTQGAYSPTVYTAATTVAIDPNVADTVTSGGTTTAIPGAPFIWTPASNTLNQQYTSGTTPGCATPLNSITSGSIAGTTKLNGLTIATGDVAYPIGSSTFDAQFDSKGYLWIARPTTIDVVTVPPGSGTATVPVAIIKMLPNYGTAFTPAQTVANTTFTYFTGAGMTNTLSPRTLSIDGDGNVWFPPNGGHGMVELSNDGVGLSPITSTNDPGDPGFRGSTCTNCKYNGETAETYSRNINTLPQRPTFDLSGNVWSPLGGSNAGAMLVLVGIAGPTVSPNALGLKNKTLATRP